MLLHRFPNLLDSAAPGPSSTYTRRQAVAVLVCQRSAHIFVGWQRIFEWHWPQLCALILAACCGAVATARAKESEFMEVGSRIQCEGPEKSAGIHVRTMPLSASNQPFVTIPIHHGPKLAVMDCNRHRWIAP